MEILECVENLYYWHYDSSFCLLESNSPDAEYLNKMFQASDCRMLAENHFTDSNLPILLADRIGLLWLACSTSGPVSELQSIYMVGPVFSSPQSEQHFKHLLNRHLLSVSAKRRFLSFMDKLPVIAVTQLQRIGIGMYYCINNSRISLFDIMIQQFDFLPHIDDEEDSMNISENGNGEYENLMLQMIEEGNLNYKSILSSHIGAFSVSGILDKSDSLRNFKNIIITSVTLCSRAAIRGGLTRNLALRLSDYYIQSIEAAESISEIASIQNKMMDDFVNRVHSRKRNGLLSPATRACLDAIELHLLEPLSAKDISALTGYVPYYITRLFKTEMGLTLSDYVHQRKIEYAKILLKEQNIEIGEIAIRLSFSSSSHFSSVFRKITGISPTQYRTLAC